jgi:O-antigen/teichoic acid export membrane protein
LREPSGRGIAWFGTLAANGAILVCRLVTGVLSARLLGPHARGGLAVVRLFPDLVGSLGTLSLHEAVTFRTARGRADAGTVRASGLVAALLLAVVVLPPGLLLVPLLLRGYGDLVALSRLYLLALAPCLLVHLTLCAWDLGTGRMGRYNALRVLPFLVNAAGLVLLAALGRVTVEGALWCSWAGIFAAAAVRLWMGRSEGRARPSTREARRLVRFGLHFHGAAVLALLASNADRLLVVFLWDERAVGLYAVALTLATTGLALLSRSIHTVLFPRIAGQRSPEERRRLLAKALRHSMLLLTAGVVVIAALAPALVPLLFGEEFREARAAAAVLVLAYLPLGLRQILVRAMRGVGEGRAGTVSEALALGGFVVAAWPLGRALGLPGVGAALFLGNAAGLAHLVLVARERLGVSLRECWGLNAGTLRESVAYARRALGVGTARRSPS